MDNDTQFDPAAIRMAYFALLLSGRKYDNLELAVAQEMLKMNHLVSERMDSNHKDAVKKIWERDLVGHRAIIFKCKDRVGSKEAPNGYRIAPYCIDLGKVE